MKQVFFVLYVETQALENIMGSWLVMDARDFLNEVFEDA